MKDYGMLGVGDEIIEEEEADFGITDRIIGSLMNSLMKNLNKQFRQFDKGIDGPGVKNYPNGIRVKIGPSTPTRRKSEKSLFNKQISEKQLERMSSLPRIEAVTKVKRLNDKIVYELNTPGIESADDIFISKLESGYEIKVIGEKKVYVNSLPINLPLMSLSMNKEKLFVEFSVGGF